MAEEAELFSLARVLGFDRFTELGVGFTAAFLTLDRKGNMEAFLANLCRGVATRKARTMFVLPTL